MYSLHINIREDMASYYCHADLYDMDETLSHTLVAAHNTTLVRWDEPDDDFAQLLFQALRYVKQLGGPGLDHLTPPVATL
jgi:hypothetical protein